MSPKGGKPPSDLEALRKRLQEREEAARKAAAQAPLPAKGKAAGSPRAGGGGNPPHPSSAQPPGPPPAPEPPLSFDDEMRRLGIVPGPPAGPEKILARPADRPAGSPVPDRPADPGSGFGDDPLPPELDDEALWALGTKGVVSRGRGIVRAAAGRSEALPTLDLHGFSEEDAVHELRRFVTLHRGAEPRWIRVITGRATHGLGVVRRAAVAWLRGNASIAGFHPAPPDQGGAGVLLVQLRRKRAP